LGVHGQTVLHERPTADQIGRTVQLLDAERLAAGCGRPVAFDFRTADVAAGGEGAPLAPIYHAARARASGLPAPVAALNLGGVANVTFVQQDGELLAFDTGPANGMIDLVVQARGAGRFDEGGRLAMAGTIDQAVLEQPAGSALFRQQAAQVAGPLRLPDRERRSPVAGGRRRHPDRLHRGQRGAGL
jgi:anhydro-N-acetylmuramic acid kinase